MRQYLPNQYLPSPLPCTHSSGNADLLLAFYSLFWFYKVGNLEIYGYEGLWAVKNLGDNKTLVLWVELEKIWDALMDSTEGLECFQRNLELEKS